MPQRAEDGLLVLCREIPLHKHPQQVPVSPDLTQIDVEEVGLGFYFKVPGFIY
jgi:hypothetical protein